MKKRMIKNCFKTGLVLALVLSLCSCGPMKNLGKPVESIAEEEQSGKASQPASGTQAATEAGIVEVTEGQYGQAGDYLVSKKVQLPAQAQFPKDEDFIKEDGKFDSDGYLAANEAWYNDYSAQLDISEETVSKMYDYYKKTIPYLLKDEKNQNILYSPVNVYLALGMLCEVTDGDTRQQILDVLGEKDIDSLRESVKQIWNTSYADDGTVTSLLAASLWMNQDIEFNQETIDKLADFYYAESYKGQPGTPGMDAALQGWLNEHTGNLLKEEASQITLDPATVLALATTLYYKASWAEDFPKDATTTDIFHAVKGDVETEFMHTSANGSYYWGDHFTAIRRELANSGSMTLILPEEGKTPQDLLEDAEVIEFIEGNTEWENEKYVMIHESIPKFDVNSMTELSDAMKKLGIQDVFVPNKADFSPMLKDDEDTYLSSAQHAVRVKIDEEGVEAAAFTVMMMENAAMEMNDEVDFVLDRPFLFVITGANGLPLFTGIVETP